MKNKPQTPIIADSWLTWCLARLATRTDAYWRGTVSELHAELMLVAREHNVDTSELPQAPNALSRAMQSRRRLLSAHGLSFSLLRRNFGAQISLVPMRWQLKSLQRPAPRSTPRRQSSRTKRVTIPDIPQRRRMQFPLASRKEQRVESESRSLAVSPYASATFGSEKTGGPSGQGEPRGPAANDRGFFAVKGAIFRFF